MAKPGEVPAATAVREPSNAQLNNETALHEDNGRARRAAPTYTRYDRAVISPGNGRSAPRDEQLVLSMFARLRGPREKLRGNDDTSLRDHLVMLHTPLVEHCARNFLASGEPLEDLVQEGYVGLIKAVDRFDPDKGVRFSTYACHLITGEIRHYLRDLGKLIHEPGWHSELRQRIARTSDQLTQKLGRPPQPEEIAETLNIRPEAVRDVLKNQQILTVDSLDDSGSENEDDFGNYSSDADELALSTESQEPLVDNRLMLGAALPQLKDLEKQAVQLFFFEELSKTEVSRRLGISVNYAAYLIKQGTQHLRHIIEQSDESNALAPWQARAAQLIAIFKTAVKNSAKLKAVGTKSEPATAAHNTFAEFVQRLDEEVERSARYGHTFSMVWFQVQNWNEATRRLDATQARRAHAEFLKVARRCCRSVDRLVPIPANALPGLHVLILMPHTGETGAAVGQRLLERCQPHIIYPAHAAAIDLLDTAYALAAFPQHGANTESLFRHLGGQLKL